MKKLCYGSRLRKCRQVAACLGELDISKGTLDAGGKEPVICWMTRGRQSAEEPEKCHKVKHGQTLKFHLGRITHCFPGVKVPGFL